MDIGIININDFEIISKYIHKICGLHLPYSKEYLIRQRFIFLLEKFGLKNYSELANIIKNNTINQLQRDMIISQITTGETYFFRDNHPFEALKNNIVPELISKIKFQSISDTNPTAKINIWSAAASTGQEAYSIAMSIYEFIQNNDLPLGFFNQFQIYATDIDDVSLDYAQKGVYNIIETGRGLNNNILEKYFDKEADKWRVKAFIKKIINFSKISLHENYSFQKFNLKFDIIFARNVLIYFDETTKMNILKNFHKLLKKEGYLFLGATENLYGTDTDFESAGFKNTMFYRPK